jgi:hypothetical protein
VQAVRGLYGGRCMVEGVGFSQPNRRRNREDRVGCAVFVLVPLDGMTSGTQSQWLEGGGGSDGRGPRVSRGGESCGYRFGRGAVLGRGLYLGLEQIGSRGPFALFLFSFSFLFCFFPLNFA